VNRARNRALLLGAIAAAPFAGWGIAWAYHAHRVAFWTFTGITVAVAFCAWLVIRLTSEGRHGGKGTSRDEETAALFASMNRPAEVASEPPAEYLSAPVTALPGWAVQDGDAPPIAGLPVVHHDEFAPPPSRYDGHASGPGGYLTPLPAMALAAVVTLGGLIGKTLAGAAQQLEDEDDAEAEMGQLRDEVQRLKDERDFPHSASPALWASGEFKSLLSDTFVGGIPVVLDEHGLVKAAWAEVSEES